MNNQNLRSTRPSEYQELLQPIGAMSKNFVDGHQIPYHDHKRDQLLFAVGGMMRLKTNEGAWIVPPVGAIYIPSGIKHSVSMHGDVDMRTLYIDPLKTDKGAHLLTHLKVITVSNLLRELILALCEEPLQYEVDSRGYRIAQMIEQEILAAPELFLHVLLPRDKRLQILCANLLADPSDRKTLATWSQTVGASTRTLSRLFERELGMSFNQWRQRVRFHNSLAALSNGVSISKVAFDNGYDSPSAFTAAFSKLMGMTPSKILNY
jgi:AraC-like DNA-binding protein